MPATLERDHVKAPGRPDAPAPVRERERERLEERPVFASESHHRTRVLRAVGWSLAGLTAVWLAALVLGAFGLSPLPSVTPGARDSAPPANEVGTRAPQAAEREASRAATEREAADASSRTAAARASERRASERSGSSDGDGDGATRSGSGSGTSGSSPSGSGTTTTTTPPAAAAPTTTTPTRGNSTTAPGSANRPDRTTTDTAPGNSGTAPGQTRTDGTARGGRSAG